MSEASRVGQDEPRALSESPGLALDDSADNLGRATRACATVEGMPQSVLPSDEELVARLRTEVERDGLRKTPQHGPRDACEASRRCRRPRWDARLAPSAAHDLNPKQANAPHCLAGDARAFAETTRQMQSTPILSVCKVAPARAPSNEVDGDVPRAQRAKEAHHHGLGR